MSAIPPYFVGGTPRLLRWCKTLPSHGWRVSIAGFSDIPFLKKQDRAPENVQCLAVPFETKLSRLVGRFTARVRSNSWPDRFRPQLPRLLTEIKRLFTYDPPDIVMVTVPSFSLFDRDFLTNLQSLKPGRVIVDQRDMFSLNDEQARTDEVRARARELEDGAAELFDGAVAVSELYKSISKQWLPGKPVALIPNGFMRTNYRPGEGLSWPGRLRGELRFLYVGMAYGKRSPALLIPGFKLAIQKRPELAQRLKFSFIGEFQADAMGDWGELPGVLEIEAQVPYKEIPLRLIEADVLNVTIGDVQTIEGIPGAKVLEYLGARRPILAVTTGAAAKVVEMTQTGLTADPNDPEAVCRAVLQFDDLWQADKPFTFGDQSLTDPWEAENLAAKLVTFFESIIAMSAPCAIEPL